MNMKGLILLVRPWQWTKNLMLLFPPFLSGSLLHPGVLKRGILPFLAFCSVSSSVYIFNDLMDRHADALHPQKCNRPVPSGAILPSVAWFLSLALLSIGIVLAARISTTLLFFLVSYLGVTICYNLTFKHRPIFDLFCIATGFVIRLYAGGNVFGVEISDWLFLTVFLLAMFLSLGKRASEQRVLGTQTNGHRKSLEAYPEGFLEGAMLLSGAAVLVTYAMYAINTPYLVFTVPLCMFGLLRYSLRIRQGQSGDPSEALFRDLPLLLISLLWVLMVGWSVYR